VRNIAVDALQVVCPRAADHDRVNLGNPGIQGEAPARQASSRAKIPSERFINPSDGFRAHLAILYYKARPIPAFRPSERWFKSWFCLY
jgi:hypothetical protein